MVSGPLENWRGTSENPPRWKFQILSPDTDTVDLENVDAPTPIREHQERGNHVCNSNRVPTQQVIDNDRQPFHDGQSSKPPPQRDKRDKRNGHLTQRSATDEQCRLHSKESCKTSRREEKQDPDDDPSSSSLSDQGQSDDYRSSRRRKSPKAPSEPSAAPVARSSTAPLVQGSFYKLNQNLLGS